MTIGRSRWALVGAVALVTWLAAPHAAAQQISVDQVVARMMLVDAQVNDLTANTTRNAGKVDELRGTTVARRTNQSRVAFTQDGSGNPVNKLSVNDIFSFAAFDNDTNSVVSRDLGLDPANSDWRTLQRLVSTSPIDKWRFLGGDSSAPVAGNNQYTLEVEASNVRFEVTVDYSLGAMVRRKTYTGGTVAVDETWSNFTLVGGVNLAQHYAVLTTADGKTNTVDLSSIQLNTNPPDRRFHSP